MTDHGARDYVDTGGLRVERVLYDFINDEVLPGTGVSPEQFWEGFGDIVVTLGPRNRELLAVRDRLQRSIDDWHREREGTPHDAAALPHVPRDDRVHRARRRTVRDRHRGRRP